VTPTQTFVAAILSAILTSSAWPYFGPKLIEWKNRKKAEEQKQQREAGERRERERDEWMRDADKAYKRVSGECSSCRREIERLKREEIEPLKRDNAAMKEALLDRIEALDEILPYITSLPEEKIRELRSANRAHRQAVFRTFS
jgi:hypothetical protein